jgi:16S rRNA (guanine966-N2)-methyltransferase
MRERLFSMLQHPKYPSLADAQVADIFAGTGALGLEALSRGAAHVTFVEMSRPSVHCLRDNIQALNARDQTTVISADARTLAPAKQAFDIIFMDAPYRQGLTIPVLERILVSGWSKPDTLMICELASDEDFSLPDGLTLVDDRSQGKQRILFLIDQRT